MYIHVGKGLPTYCVTRVVGRQPLAAKYKQSNQSTLKTLYKQFLIAIHTYWVRQGKVLSFQPPTSRI